MKKLRVLMVTGLAVLIAVAFMADTALAEYYTGSEPPSGEELMQIYNSKNAANKKAWRATAYLGKVPDDRYEGGFMYFFAVEATGRGGLKQSIEDIRVVHTDTGIWIVFVGLGQKYIMEK